jgi:hypothetical protein
LKIANIGAKKVVFSCRFPESKIPSKIHLKFKFRKIITGIRSNFQGKICQ